MTSTSQYITPYYLKDKKHLTQFDLQFSEIIQICEYYVTRGTIPYFCHGPQLQ